MVWFVRDSDFIIPPDSINTIYHKCVIKTITNIFHLKRLLSRSQKPFHDASKKAVVYGVVEKDSLQLHLPDKLIDLRGAALEYEIAVERLPFGDFARHRFEHHLSYFLQIVSVAKHPA